MKYVFQFLIIGTISFVAEVLDILLPFPIPASVYGLVIMFLLLLFKIIKPEQIADVADFFVAVMPIFFISTSVSLMTNYAAIKTQGILLILAAFISTIVTIAITGIVAQVLIRFKRRKKHE